MDSFDVLVVGGGPAGLSAALTLGRGMRRVLLVDDERPRNAPVAQSWGFLTRDGTPPDRIRALGRKEVTRYDVEVRDVAATEAARTPDGFEVTLSEGPTVACRALVLATGVQDILPDVPGLREAWGQTAVHCPYCHGWELRGRPTAFYGKGDDAFNMGRFLPLWTGDLVVLTDGPSELTADQRAELEARGVRVDERAVGRLEVEDGEVRAVVFADGERHALGALYVKPEVRPKSALAGLLGAALSPGRICPVDEVGRVEGVPRLYVVGDAACRTHHLVSAAAGGAETAFAVNHDLVVADTPALADR